jgi:hypothetical protein
MNIIIGWLIVATLDIAYAISVTAVRGGSPSRMLQGIASGIMGPAAFQGGTATEAFGLALHYFIALMIVVVYAAMCRRIALLREHPVLWGAFYGVGVWVVMNFIVIPLSRAARPRYVMPWVLYGIAVHIFIIGIPAAYFAARHVRRNA